MRVENPIMLVSALKGAPISILFALGIAKQNCGAQYLARTTSYSINKTTEGLLKLQDYGLVVRIDRYNWGLSEYAMQLPLMVDNSSLPLVPGNDGTRNDCESNGSATATTTIEGKTSRKRKAAAEAQLTRNECESIRILHEGGIGEPTASNLIKLDWVTPAYIKAHLEKGRDNHDEIGLVIHRMKFADPAPETREEQERNAGKKYLTGKYAEFIIH